MLIYGIIELETNKYIYVGSTKRSLEVRKKEYLRNSGHNIYVKQFINSNGGFDKFKFIVLETTEFENIRLLRERERYYYDLLKPNCNIIRPTITQDELKERVKNYNNTNKEQAKEQFKKKYKNLTQEQRDERNRKWRVWYEKKSLQKQDELLLQKDGCTPVSKND